jgi:hypothetical protein
LLIAARYDWDMKRHAFLFLSLPILLGSAQVLASQTEHQAVPFAHNALDQANKITLTPGFSPDGQSIYFAQSECRPIWECPQTLKVSRLGEDGWSAPELVALPVAGRVDYPSVTPDGTRLLFSWNGNQNANGTWSETRNFDLWALALDQADAIPVRLKGEDLARVRGGKTATLRFVNNETAPVLTREGDLYFWGERLDVPGGRTVFKAEKKSDGIFRAPTPLPAPINSIAEDDGSWVSPDGQILLITYNSRGGCGGSDLFVSYRQGDGWNEPRNLGCEINSEFDEGAGSITPDGERIIFMSTRPMAGETPDSLRSYSLWQAPAKGIRKP